MSDKPKINHSIKLWDEESQSMQRYDFFIEFNPNELPAKVFHRAKKNKGGKSKVAHGAIVINFVKED